MVAGILRAPEKNRKPGNLRLYLVSSYEYYVPPREAGTRRPTPDKAPVAQLDRVPGYEPGGRRFESFRARQNRKGPHWGPFLFLCVRNEMRTSGSTNSHREFGRPKGAPKG